jgi:hypothetical protein
VKPPALDRNGVNGIRDAAQSVHCEILRMLPDEYYWAQAASYWSTLQGGESRVVNSAAGLTR